MHTAALHGVPIAAHAAAQGPFRLHRLFSKRSRSRSRVRTVAMASLANGAASDRAYPRTLCLSIDLARSAE